MSRHSPATIKQASVVPFRRCADGISFCLITSLNTGRWIFPKGVVDPGETQRETALKEALEEAGLLGRILEKPLGVYRDAKWGATLEVTVLLMEVDDCQESWPEKGYRRRRWARPGEARRLVSKPQLKKMLKRAIERIKEFPD